MTTGHDWYSTSAAIALMVEIHHQACMIGGHASKNWIPRMIKPGSKDRKVSILITGMELTELQQRTWLLADSFGLDTRIENYQGKRPIGLYQWDLECLLAVIDGLLEDDAEYPDKSSAGYEAISQLGTRLRDEYSKAFDPS